MPSFDIVRESTVDKTFRVAKIASDYDLNLDKVSERFIGSIDLPDEWNIGLIVGNSGTGKTTIARELFGDAITDEFEYTHASVIDDMPEGCSFDDISRMFYAVGFGSVPCWLKPYQVLSNGEKMRVDVVRSLLTHDFVCFDEFTSVVDRNVAKTVCVAVGGGNQAIWQTVHSRFVPSRYNGMASTGLGIRHGQDETFFSVSPRPERSFEVKRCGRNEWEKFRRYHYLNHDLVSSAQCFGLYEGDNIIGFCGVLHQPHGYNKKIKRCTRLVILPDYQGIGLGTKFLEIVADYYVAQGFYFHIKTSAKNLICALNKRNGWQLRSYGFSKCTSNKSAIDYKRDSLRHTNKTATFRRLRG